MLSDKAPTEVKAISALLGLFGFLALVTALVFGSLSLLQFNAEEFWTNSAMSLGFALSAFVMVWALMHAKPWAYPITFGLSVVWIVLSSIDMSYLEIMIGIAVLFLLTRPNVREYFGRKGKWI